VRKNVKSIKKEKLAWMGNRPFDRKRRFLGSRSTAAKSNRKSHYDQTGEKHVSRHKHHGKLFGVTPEKIFRARIPLRGIGAHPCLLQLRPPDNHTHVLGVTCTPQSLHACPALRVNYVYQRTEIHSCMQLSHWLTVRRITYPSDSAKRNPAH
jgi:hypothetical protein